MPLRPHHPIFRAPSRIFRKVQLMSIDFRSEIPTDKARLRRELEEMGNMPRLDQRQSARFEQVIERFKALNDEDRAAKAAIGDPFKGDTRNATRTALRDRAMRVLETQGRRLAPHQQ